MCGVKNGMSEKRLRENKDQKERIEVVKFWITKKTNNKEKSNSQVIQI